MPLYDGNQRVRRRDIHSFAMDILRENDGLSDECAVGRILDRFRFNGHDLQATKDMILDEVYDARVYAARWKLALAAASKHSIG